jgi:hypothetical protein
LHFVDDDPRFFGTRRALAIEGARIASKARRFGVVEQVVAVRIREVLMDPRGLPGRARTEQKERVLRGRGRENIESDFTSKT